MVAIPYAYLHAYIHACNTFAPHIKACSHATYIMLHSLGVLQLPRCGTTSQCNTLCGQIKG